MKKFNFRKAQKQPSRGVLIKRCSKICSKFTGEHPCQSVISIKLQSNFIEIALRHGCSSIKLLQIFRTPFPRNTSGWVLLKLEACRGSPKWIKTNILLNIIMCTQWNNKILTWMYANNKTKPLSLNYKIKMAIFQW